ncbi:NAD(P)H-quinone oxidoreductase [Hyphomicrobiales bacterium 4NK60-0047b]|jgi:NADPH2:quinone reductase
MSLPETMRCVPTSETKGAAGLQVVTEALPEVGANDILIKVQAAGINRPDILQRDGLYPAPKGHSHILGLEVAGEIVALGSDVTTHALGDQVTALVNGGGYAEYCLADSGSALPIPKGLSLVEAAGLPETFFTVWYNVFQTGGLKAGEWFMVHGGTSGIGTTAIQMAKAFGAKVIATCGSDEKCSAVLELGADVAVNYKTQDFVEVAKEATGKAGVNVILDMVGGSYIEKNYSAASVDGRIVQIAFLEGSKVEINYMRLMMKRLVHTGSTLRARDNQTKAGIASEVQEKIWPLLEDKTIKPVVSKCFALDDIRSAHEFLESGAHIGKVILDMDL